MNDQLFTNSYTQIFWKGVKITVGRNIIWKNSIYGYQIKFPEVSLIYGWILTFGMGTRYPPQKDKVIL